MYCATWYEFRCPGCGKTNFINNGNENDLTGCDVEYIQCHSCYTIFDLEGVTYEPWEATDVENGIMMRKAND